MSLWSEPKVTQLSALSRRLQDANDNIQSAKHSGDKQALGYAEGESLRLRRAIAKLDPRGYGHNHLGLLTETERAQALAV